MIFISFIFAILLLFVLAYFAAFEYCRYKTAKVIADRLSGSAVFKIVGHICGATTRACRRGLGSCRMIKWRVICGTSINSVICGSGRNTARSALGGEFPLCTLSVCAVGS